VIKVTDSQGRQQLINPRYIVRVSEAGPSSCYSGTRSQIRLVNETLCIDCKQTVEEIGVLMEAQANAATS